MQTRTYLKLKKKKSERGKERERWPKAKYMYSREKKVQTGLAGTVAVSKSQWKEKYLLCRRRLID